MLDIGRFDSTSLIQHNSAERLPVVASIEIFGKVGYTLTADTGAYAQTGASAALRAARRISASGGSYAQTGSTAGLKVSYRIASAAGSYSISGTDAALRAARNFASAAGSYSHTGSVAALRAARNVIADAGDYSLIGSDASLMYDTGVRGSVVGSLSLVTQLAVTESPGATVSGSDLSASVLATYESLLFHAAGSDRVVTSLIGRDISL